MKYDIVMQEEKTIIGYRIGTNNQAADMRIKIGGLWGRFFGELYGSAAMKAGSSMYGIYTDYESDAAGDYMFLAACEASGEKPDKTDGFGDAEIRRLPAGTYARFTVQGNLPEAIGAFWQKFWAMELPRSYVCDYEEYESPDMDNGICHIYIGLKES